MGHVCNGGGYAQGVLAVKLALLLPEYADNDVNLQNLQTGLGLAAVVGHIFPIWADFRGGKGVATLFGLVLGISPWTALSCVGIFSLVLYLTRFVSLSSILASIAFPFFILVIFNVENPVYRVFAIAVALMVLLTHQKNIGRLLRGSESKVPILKVVTVVVNAGKKPARTTINPFFNLDEKNWSNPVTVLVQ